MLNTYPETPSIFSSNHFDRASDVPEDADQFYSLIKDGKHKKFVCTLPDCQKVFRFHSEMQRHIASHSAFSPHKCTFDGCGREFKRPSALENHIRSQHTGEAPLLCPYPGCGLRFATEAKYRYHIISHLDEKPHKCAFLGCNKSFMTLSQLKQHEKSPSVHKKLDVMSQLEDRGRGLATPGFDEADSLGKLERSSSSMKVEPSKKIKYDVQNKKLTELLTSLQTKVTEESDAKVEDQSEPELDHILTENEILRRKLESSEQMLEMMRQQITQIHNTSGAEQSPLPDLPGFDQEIAPQGLDTEDLDSFLIREADSYLIHDPYVVESRPYFQEGDYFTRSEPAEGGLGDDKLSFFFPSFSFEEFTCSPSRQLEK